MANAKNRPSKLRRKLAAGMKKIRRSAIANSYSFYQQRLPPLLALNSRASSSKHLPCVLFREKQQGVPAKGNDQRKYQNLRHTGRSKERKQISQRLHWC